jgi:uncharacterized protein (TIGR03437 family)
MLWLAVTGFSVSAIHAQTCPSPNFLQGSSVTVFDYTSAAGLQRQPDGSFTRQRYQAQSPYKKIDSVPNYQSAFVNCSGAGARTFKTPPGWIPLADQPGAASQSLVFSDFLGNGTPVGLAVVPGGYAAGPAVDSLLVVILNSDGSAKSSAYYPVSAHPTGLLVADLNNDGKKDVVVVSSGSGTASDPGAISVLLGKGDGTLQPAVRYTGHTGAASAVAFDLNGDHNLDLAIANSGSGDVSILLGRGDGTFAAPVNYPATAGASSLALGDFNGDGRADLVAGGGQNLSMLLGNGDGTFRPTTNLPLSITPTALAPGDFNKDGKLDLAVTDSTGGTVSILLGDGTGKFAGEYDYVAGYEPTGLFAMDLDGDGNLDVVIATGHPDVLLPNPYSDYVMAFFGRGDGTLIGPPTYPTGSRLSSLVLADFNGDGKPDVAVAAGDLWILLSSGGGSFRTPVRIPIPASNNSAASADSLAAGDFNGDGKQDLVVGTAYGNGVYVLLGNGDGTFQAPVLYPTGGNVSSIAVADFNGDGKLDIAACGYSSSPPANANAGILLGNGNGTFQSVKSLPGFGAGPYWLVAGDFNKDGKPDLAIANQGTPGDSTDNGGVQVFLGQGNGSFQNPVNYPAGINPNFITAADVNGDNVPDLIVATRAPNFTYSVDVLLGKGDGTFGSTASFSTEYGPTWIAVADLNGDGKPDLAIAHCCGDTDTTFMLGNGDGTFQPDVHLAAAVSPATLQVADLNGDGKPDLVIGLGGFASAVAVFLNISTAPLTNVNGASFLAGPLAPNSWATAYGNGLATVSQGASALNQTNIGGTSVTVTDASGVQQLAPLSYVSPTQVNYMVPGGAALGPATVTVSAGGAAVASGSVTIAAIGPGLFLYGGTNLVAANVLRVHADNSQTVENDYTVTSSGALVAAPIDLSPATDQVFLVLYATGVRGHSAASNSVTVTAGGVSLPVSYAGAQPQYPGLDQIDALLPQSLAGKGDMVIQVTVDGEMANTGHVTIQ